VTEFLAAAALAEGGDVRTAIVIARLGVSREEAVRLLDAAGGSIRKALEQN
jgi:N-acetylmuramic acid 6-phosphate (MurNAc-6-P) etherase